MMTENQTLNLYGLNKLLTHAVEGESIKIDERTVYCNLYSELKEMFGEEFFNEWYEYENIIKYLYLYGKIPQELIDAADLYEQAWRKTAFLIVSKELILKNPKLLKNLLSKISRLDKVEIETNADFKDEKLNSILKVESNAILNNIRIYSNKVYFDVGVRVNLLSKNENTLLVSPFVNSELVIEVDNDEFLKTDESIEVSKQYRFNYGPNWDDFYIPVTYMLILEKLGIPWVVFRKIETDNNSLINNEYGFVITDTNAFFRNKHVLFNFDPDDKQFRKCGAFVRLETVKSNPAITVNDKEYKIVEKSDIYPIADVTFDISVSLSFKREAN
jgi:hypothetical protein